MTQHPSNPDRRSLLFGLFGAAALAGSGASGEAAQSTDTEKSNVKLVNDFVAVFNTRDLSRITPFLAADCVYRVNETAPPVTGPDAIRARLTPIVEASQKVDWEVLDTYAKGPMVINHRIDRFVSTTRPLTWAGVGGFFVKDGKITAWFDYTISRSRG